jgi:hypothetical protein
MQLAGVTHVDMERALNDKLKTIEDRYNKDH